MKSKTSFCNGTVLRKNLTRFAPVWVLYILCLLLGMALMYFSDRNNFWFANNMGELIQYSAIINLIYAPIVAMLLFGDLYNTRMCNALHAMPLTRGCWFGTNVLSGALFSLIPTAVMCAMSVPLLMSTFVVGAPWIALWAFVGMNLTYLCFFGIAVFSVFCAGNRFGMAAIYALLNGGAFVVWFLIDTIYTPMLYGVVTPITLTENLTPVYKLTQNVCVELEPYNKLIDLYGHELVNAKANFWLLPEGWISLGIWAAVGIGFMVLGRLLYGKRNLECAGDAVAVKPLEPVFQVCFAVCAAALAAIFLQLFFGLPDVEALQIIFLLCGLIAGWFAAKMIIERSVRVFRFKNWLSLAALTAILTVTVGLTHFDVFGIETWMPVPEDVRSVTFGYSGYRGMSEELTNKSDIEAVIRLQELALEDRLDEGGAHMFVSDQEYTYPDAKEQDLLEQAEYRYASTVHIYYNMENGRTVHREYIIWCDGEEGDIVNEYLSRWEVVSVAGFYSEITAVNIAGEIAYGEPGTVLSISGTTVPAQYSTPEEIESLLDAIRADCEARTMTQKASFHPGHFETVNSEGIQENTRSFWIEFAGDNYNSGSFYIFADSENTLNWLRERDLLTYTVHSDNGFNG